MVAAWPCARGPPIATQLASSRARPAFVLGTRPSNDFGLPTAPPPLSNAPGSSGGCAASGSPAAPSAPQVGRSP